ncbi:TetR/AcrR family transcriptional regulator [Curtobacterium sp. ISL-83]|uniref:TetR/AcrR family transcriptional regulator n=1 Tax=Curtobacterium sp. ISL-83 TaxID=2819145 RepID=UPI001BE95538|nr:TetR/AcrR family transcriptional regulator [Curtobacterium sp. ISL-83]MBT2502407.1 TetR/AcrR family transcriptional regulator [Curtobacterium sp. ISL-83]
MTSQTPVLSTAERRRPLVTAAALETFAKGGYHGATIADVAQAAGISPAYVFKLFPGKDALFVTALERCFEQIVEALAAGADGASDRSPDGLLDAMGGAYAELVRDRTLLMLQVHAQSVAEIPDIGAALRAGLAEVTQFAKRRTGADDDAVQRFMAYGQLCHLIVTAGIDEQAGDWAAILSHGIRHPD